MLLLTDWSAATATSFGTAGSGLGGGGSGMGGGFDASASSSTSSDHVCRSGVDAGGSSGAVNSSTGMPAGPPLDPAALTGTLPAAAPQSDAAQGSPSSLKSLLLCSARTPAVYESLGYMRS